MLIIFIFFVALCALIPVLIEEKRFFETQVRDITHDDARAPQFRDYVVYKFRDWLATTKYGTSIVLVWITWGLIVTGALVYGFFTNSSPSHALWAMFCWSTRSGAQHEESMTGRVVGAWVTIMGLVILSLLLSVVAEAFGSSMHEVKTGATSIIEGGHTVILGATSALNFLVSELGKAEAQAGASSTIAILTQQDRERVEESFEFQKSRCRVLVRRGNPCELKDLQKVSAGSAHKIIVLADTTLSKEQADAKTIRILLTLLSKEWPTHGHIVAQCCCDSNSELFRQLDPAGNLEAVVVGDFIAKLMAQSVYHPGYAAIFRSLLGFEGSEFYVKEFPEIVGLTFRDVVFRFPDAVVLGVSSGPRDCHLNPGWEYQIQPGDRIIVLAEDRDSFSPFDEQWAPGSPTMDSPSPHRNGDLTRLHSMTPTAGTAILVYGWNNKVGPLLSSLDDSVAHGTEVALVSPHPVEEREQELAKYQEEFGKFTHLSLKQLFCESQQFTSRAEISNLHHQMYSGMVILADVTRITPAEADETTLACLAQMQYLQSEVPIRQIQAFAPVIEICEDASLPQLKACGFSNYALSTELIAQALASVAIDPALNMIFTDLIHSHPNKLAYRDIAHFVGEGERLPAMLSFWEAAYRLSLAGDVSVIGWTVHNRTGLYTVELNPADKYSPRPWTRLDRLVVIEKVV